MVKHMLNIDELLFLGENVFVGDVPIYQYDLLTLLKMEENYRKLVSQCVLKPIDFFKRSQVNKPEMDKMTMIDMLIMFDGDEYMSKVSDSIIEMLEFVTKLDWRFYPVTESFTHFHLGDNGKYGGTPIIIDKSNYDEVMKTIAKVYHVPRNDPYEKYGNYDMADDETKEVIDMLIEEEREDIKESNITFQSILEAVACNSDSGLNIFNIKNATVYQLFRCFYRIEQNYNYKHTITGLYSGCVDGKKLNSDDISWARTIQVD